MAFKRATRLNRFPALDPNSIRELGCPSFTHMYATLEPAESMFGCRPVKFGRTAIPFPSSPCRRLSR